MGLGQGGINCSVMSMLGLKFLLDIQVKMLVRQLDIRIWSSGKRLSMKIKLGRH